MWLRITADFSTVATLARLRQPEDSGTIRTRAGATSAVIRSHKTDIACVPFRVVVAVGSDFGVFLALNVARELAACLNVLHEGDQVLVAIAGDPLRGFDLVDHIQPPQNGSR